MRKSKVKTLTGVIITMGVVLAVTGTATVLLGQKLKTAKEERDAYETQIEDNTYTIYVALAEDEEGNPLTLKSGTVLEEGTNVEKVSVMTSMPENVYMTEDDLGKPLITDVPDGMPIYQVMVAQDGAEEGDRYNQVAAANLMVSQAENDVIDVRIMFPNGTDYTILSKKRIKNLNMEGATFDCLMDEDERLRMSSAIVDAYLTSGAYIYTAKYAEGTISEETIPNYPVKTETRNLIAEDPNIINVAELTLNQRARETLEAQLANLMSEQYEAVVSGLGIDDHADGMVIMEGSRSMEEKDNNGTTTESSSYNTEQEWSFEFSNEETSEPVDEEVTTESLTETE